MATTPAAKKRAGKIQRLDETPSSPVLVHGYTDPKINQELADRGQKIMDIGNEHLEAVVATIVNKKDEIAKNKGGRPTLYNDELSYTICERIVEGDSLRSICKEDDMPAISTVFMWLDTKPEFLDRYTRAKDNQADTNTEDIQHLAKRVIAGEVEPQAARVAIDAYKWTASKLKPKKYGDKIDMTSGGEKIAPVLVRFIDSGNDARNTDTQGV